MVDLTMTQKFVLLLLAGADDSVAYGPEGIFSRLKERLGDIFPPTNESEFNATLTKMAARSLVDIVGGTVTITRKGRAEVRHDPLVCFIREMSSQGKVLEADA